MDRLQVLAVTMHQQDISLVEKMNIRCSAVLANQSDREEVEASDTVYGQVKMITTATRGVGLNRNIAMLASDGEFLLFADDDVVYYDDMAEAVVQAFDANPRADVIIFGMDILKAGKITRRQEKVRRLRVWNAMRYGTYRIAIRRSALLRYNLSFNQCFGGGCPFSAGEDSLFLKACFDRGLRVYTHDYVLGTCCKDTSTWFTEYGERYFYDKGVLVRYLFPRLYGLMAMYFAVCFKRETVLSMSDRIRLVYAGIRGGKTMRTYDEWK